MKRLNYFNPYLPEDEPFYDWRVQAMNYLEKMIVCESSDSHIPFSYPEDVAQEIRLVLWANLIMFNPQKSSLGTWAKKVAKNKIKDLYKKETQTQKRKDYLHKPFSYMVVDENIKEN